VTSVRTFLFFAHKTASFYFAFPIMRLFGPLVLLVLSRSSVAFSFSRSALSSSRRSRFFPFLAPRFSVFLPSLLYPPLFHLRSLLPPFPPPLSINLFFSLRSSGPRNEQRKSIGWHCGFVPSTVVLDLCVETMCGTCFLMKLLLSLYIFCILHL
jgi:hypothetical protein